jgi:flagellar hook-associated protein 1 FlgK
VDQVVSIIGEPSDTGLSSQLDQFYNTWQQLGTNPEDTAVRNNLLQYGDSAAASLHRISGQIDQLRSDQGEILQDDVAQVNQLAKNLADLNHDIQSLRGAGQAPNDLLDQRDQILGQLSNLADIQVHGDGGSEDLITIGGHALVQGTQVSELATGTDADSQTTVVWKDDSSAAQINGGEIGGVLNIQNNVLPGYLDTLDQVAQGLISSVNALHKTGKGLDGTTGQDFFTGTGARDIQVNPTVMNDPRKIAASANGAVGDGTNAQAIAKTRSQPAINGATIKEAYTGLVTRNATDATNFGNNLDTQTALTQQLSIQQQSATGVSLDEEMTDMIRFQQGYNASARVLSTMDEMLDTLINRLGAG